MTRIKYQNKEKKVMEYEDSPSGFVTLYNYKEPFMKYEEGYGFQGVLLFDGETDKVQCHLCGQWYVALSNHLAAEHSMRANQYKEEVGLSKRTALIGEKMRAKLIASGLDKRLQNLRSRKGIKHTEATKALIRKNHQGKTREHQNSKGTCPEQLIDRLVKEYQKQGKTPIERDLGFHEALIKTYGTYRNACKYAGIPEPLSSLEALKKGRETMKNKVLNKVQVISDWVYRYYDSNNKLPNKTDYKTSEEEGFYKFLIYRGSKYRDDLYKSVVIKHGKFSSTLHGEFQFSKDELLGFLRNFEKFESRKPSYSDARRGLIPHLSRYSYHFGSWKNALKLAFNN